MKRTPKPFIVEVRRGGCRPAAAVGPVQSDQTISFAEDDQPRVIWPGLDAAPELPPDARQPADSPQDTTGRILPALDEAEPVSEDPKRRGRGPARPKPAIEDQPGKARESNPIKAGLPASAVEPVASAAEETPEPMMIGSAAKAMAATLLLRHGRKRLLRSEFKRSERWKARLPSASLKGSKRRQGPQS